jgi:hypothetical protein
MLENRLPISGGPSDWPGDLAAALVSGGHVRLGD